MNTRFMKDMEEQQKEVVYTEDEVKNTRMNMLKQVRNYKRIHDKNWLVFLEGVSKRSMSINLNTSSRSMLPQITSMYKMPK